MMEQEVNDKELKGFAKLIWQILIPLNQNPDFQRAFKNEEKHFLLNLFDGENAVLIHIDHGKVDIESVKNGPKDYMKKLYKDKNCDAMLQTNTAIFLDIAAGSLSTADIFKKILKRQIKVKGIRNLRLLSDIFDFHLKSLNVTGKTLLRDVIEKWAGVYGDKTFLTYIVDFDEGLDEKYTYKDMHIISNRVANGLLNAGIKKGDGIALMNINSPEYLFTIFGAMKMGAYIVLVNTGLKGEGLKYVLDHSDASSIVIHWSFLDAFMEIKEQLPKLERVIVDLRDATENFELPKGVHTFQKIMEAPADEIGIVIDPDDMCMLMYTAGTTGLPKAITFWQGKLLGGLNIKTLMKLVALLTQPGDVAYTPLPLFHSNALFLSTFASYLSGLSLILGKRFTASRHWNICKKYGVTIFNTLGAMVTFLMKQPEKPIDKDHNVRIVNTAACPPELWKAFEKRFDTKISEAYGATDGGGFMLLTQIFDDVPVGTMGKPLPGITAEIMDDSGKIYTEANKKGELVFLVEASEVETREVKYYKDNKASKRLIRKGADGRLWFHTGDMAYKDEEGWFYFVDRKKDSIRRRGENIAPFSIENVINQHEKVLESAAYGVKSEVGEDEVMVSVVLKPSRTLKPEEIIDFCRGKMADFKIPRYIDFLEELPKNEVHRVLKRKLKEKGITPSTYDRENK